MRNEYQCVGCDAEYRIWEGRCRQCKEWGTIKEIKEKEHIIESLEYNEIRYESSCLIILYGDPGAGKTTLGLQWCLEDGRKSLFISSEQPISQLEKMERRIGSKNVQFIRIKDPEKIIEKLEEYDQEFVVIDSLQGIKGGDEFFCRSRQSLQMEFLEYLQEYAYMRNKTVVVIQHQTKNEGMRGLKYYEHLADIVIKLKLCKQGRSLIVEKNRFAEIGKYSQYKMTATGLKKQS